MMPNSFPRGGKKQEVKKSSDTLFHEKRKSKRKHNTRTKKRDDNITVEETKCIPTIAERLHNLILYKGMTILSRISDVTKYDMLVSMPGGLRGCIKVTDISESYTKLMQNIIDAENVRSKESEDLCLTDLYSPGEYVVCYVKNVNLSKKFYSLSLDPRLINQNVHNSYLVKDKSIVCVIKSIEDHGFVVDTGIDNVTAFIAIKNIEEKEAKYFPGMQLFCIIKEIETENGISVIKLSNKRKHIDNANTHDIVSLDILTPGTKLPLCITKVLSNGLQVTFGKDNIGFINHIYLDNSLDKYENNMEVIGTLLYVQPIVKFAYFSLLVESMSKRKEMYVRNKEHKKLQEGTIVEKAKVLYRESKGIVFKLFGSKLESKSLRGFVDFRGTDLSYLYIPRVFEVDSVHKCRVLSYNWMEQLYVCTTKHKILEMKYFSPTDLKLGEICIVIVTSITNKSYVQVRLGRIRGFVPPMHLSDGDSSNMLRTLKIGDKIDARVLDINIDDTSYKIKFTLRKSLIESKLPILHDIHQAQCGSKYHGIVTKIEKLGLLVRFYGNIKGWVPRKSLDNDTNVINWKSYLGKTVMVCIKAIKDESKMTLNIVTEDQKQPFINFSIGELVEGIVEEISYDYINKCVNGIYLKIRTDDNKDVRGYLPAGHMAPCLEVGRFLTLMYEIGDTISAYIFATNPILILSRTFVTDEQNKSFESLKVGNCIPCTITSIKSDGVNVILSIENSIFEFVSSMNIDFEFGMLKLHQILFVKIMAINTRNKKLTLSMALKDVWGNIPDYVAKIMTSVDLLNSYLMKLSELARNMGLKNDLTEDYKLIMQPVLGQKVTGTVIDVTDDGLMLKLDSFDLLGLVEKNHYSGNVQVNDKVSGTIMWKNYVNTYVDISLLPIITNSISSKQDKLPELPTGVALKARILMKIDWFILVLIKRNSKGYLAALPARRHANDIYPDLKPYVIHSKIRVYIIRKRNESAIVPICVLKSTFEIPKDEIVTEFISTTNRVLKRKILFEQSNVNLPYPAIKRLKTDSHETGKSNSGVANKKEFSKTETSNATNKNKRIHSLYPEDETAKELNGIQIKLKHDSNVKRKRSKIRNKMCEDKDIIEEEANRIKDIDESSGQDKDSFDKNEIEENESTVEKSLVPKIAFSRNNKANLVISDNTEISNDNGEEVEEGTKRKKKKLSTTEHRKQKQEELKICQLEKEDLVEQMPKSIDQFEQLILVSPNDSMVWLQYMLYHLKVKKIDEARAVAKRAIETIKEKDNLLIIWKQWFHLESVFGTPESLDEVFQEAVRKSNPLEIYIITLHTHMCANRHAELENVIDVMTSKFKQYPQVWIICGTALLTIGQKKKSRQIMKRALQFLPESEHVKLIARFANLEVKRGDKEYARTLLEQLLRSHAERGDVWLCYVDYLLKSGNIDMARKVVKRARAQKLAEREINALLELMEMNQEKRDMYVCNLCASVG